MKKARELGLPIPTREASQIRNTQEEFAAKLEEKRVRVQMADSLASMVGKCFFVHSSLSILLVHRH